MAGERSLPCGKWVYIKSLPLGTTKADIVEVFYNSGIQITDENINLKELQNRMSAIVSVPYDELVEIIRWAVKQNPLKSGIELFVENWVPKDIMLSRPRT